MLRTGSECWRKGLRVWEKNDLKKVNEIMTICFPANFSITYFKEFYIFYACVQFKTDQ